MDVYVNSASQGRAVQSFTSFANNGKFIERVAAFRAADKPVYV